MKARYVILTAAIVEIVIDAGKTLLAHLSGPKVPPEEYAYAGYLSSLRCV
jgi:hypothetical protein